MDPRLEKLHTLLFESTLYCAMVAIGSDATGDVQIAGRSDHNIFLIFSGNFERELPQIRKYLANFEFGDEYFFEPFLREDFMRCHNVGHDFSRRFRTKTLFGEDFVPRIELPTHEATKIIYEEALQDFYKRFSARLLNFSFWSEDAVRSMFYQFMKEVFLHLAIRQYYDAKIYPKTRDAVAEAIGTPAINDALHTIKGINTAKKERIIIVSQNLLAFVHSVLD